MNKTVKSFEKSDRMFTIAQEINLYTTLGITITGLFANLFTIYLLKLVSNADRRSSLSLQHSTFWSSHLYMLALAISDSLFLLAHLIEDVFPSISELELAHIANRSIFVCKLSLYVRNTARVCSSYLVVVFAYERFKAVKNPLLSLNYDNKRHTKVFNYRFLFIPFL